MIHIYFQIKEQESGEKSIIRLISSPENGLSTFQSVSSEQYSEKEFVQMTSFGRQTIAWKNKIDKNCEPYILVLNHSSIQEAGNVILKPLLMKAKKDVFNLKEKEVALFIRIKQPC